MDDCELLILGGASDLGMALIRRVHKNYTRIYAHYRTYTDEMQSLTDEIGENKLKWYRADLESRDETVKLICELEAAGAVPAHIVHFPSVKVVQERFHKIEWEEYEQRFNVSLRSLIEVLKKYLPQMAKKKYGKIIVMASAYTTNTPPRFVCPYVTEKYALIGITKALAAEYSDKEIQINAVSPEMINTKFLNSMSELIIEQNALNSPLKRNLNIDEVIPTIEFLLSNEANRITGQNIVITGGM